MQNKADQLYRKKGTANQSGYGNLSGIMPTDRYNMSPGDPTLFHTGVLQGLAGKGEYAKEDQ